MRRMILVAFVGIFAAACDFGVPIGLGLDPGSGAAPTIPPGILFNFSSDERAVALGDTLVIRVVDAVGAVWAVNDTSVATISGDAFEAVLRPKRVGVVRVAVHAHLRTLTRDIEIVQSLCRPETVTTTIDVGSEQSVTLSTDDCALGYHRGFDEWPADSTGPTVLTMRAEGRRLVLTDSMLVRVDVSSATDTPMVALMDSSAWSRASRRNAWGDSFIARMLPAGSYLLWVAGDPRGTSTTQLRVRQVPTCSAANAVKGTLTLGVAVEGTLDADDCHSPWGPMQEWWRVTLPSNGYYLTTVEATTSANPWRPWPTVGGGYVDVRPTYRLAGEETFEVNGLGDAGYRLRIVACASATVCP